MPQPRIKKFILLPRSSGIYQIKNTVNGKIYIGSSRNMLIRGRGHLDVLRRGISHCKVLQRAYNKYGESVFEFSVIELCSEHELIQREQFYLDTMNPEYNASKIAQASHTGVEHSQDTKSKISSITKSHWNDPTKRHNMLKNRTYPSRPKKLNANIVREIRSLWNSGDYSTPQLAKMFGCNRYNIYNIVNYKIWTSVE